MNSENCELCNSDGGEVLFRDPRFRVVRVLGSEGESYRGFCRVIWAAHVKEMTDLEEADRALFMSVVYKVEAALRASLRPDKINLASLGNMTPHLHWHVIPRFKDDPAFPQPIWAGSIASAPIIDKLADRQGIRNADAHVEWAGAVRNALNNNG